ncbi:MAG: AAA family ATPase [Hormoscilla sp. SP5CHS1]|nr:AAA family ATPase [Hormoscilla sp. SP12CHS1]MBC6452033.1 AAA family ATPase [Hormoscilla sp. SP5CHS1]
MNNKQFHHFLIGLLASGKSTFAQQLAEIEGSCHEIVSTDKIREQLFEDEIVQDSGSGCGNQGRKRSGIGFKLSLSPVFRPRTIREVNENNSLHSPSPVQASETGRIHQRISKEQSIASKGTRQLQNGRARSIKTLSNHLRFSHETRIFCGHVNLYQMGTREIIRINPVAKDALARSRSSRDAAKIPGTDRSE